MGFIAFAPILTSAVLLTAYYITCVHDKKHWQENGPSPEQLALYDAALPDSLREAFSKDEMRNFIRTFNHLDTSGKSGSVDRLELKAALLKFEPDMALEMMDEQVETMMAEADLHGTGKISFDEFVFAVLRAHKRGQPSSFMVLCDRVEAHISRDSGQRIFFGFLTLTFLVLPTCSATIFRFFKCESFPEADSGNERYLYDDHSLDCTGHRYKKFFPIVLCGIAIYPIGVPLLYTALLHKYRHILTDPDAMDREAAHNNPTIGHIEFLVHSYQPAYYW